MIRKQFGRDGKKDSAIFLTELRSLLANTSDLSCFSHRGTVKGWIEKNKYNTGAIMNVFRLVIVGALKGPHMFDIISWIGKSETLRRIDKGITILGK